MEKHLPWNLILPVLKAEADEDSMKAFENWLNNSSSNKEIFTQLQELWKQILDGNTSYHPDNEHYWNVLSKQLNFTQKEKSLPHTHTSKRTVFRIIQYVSAVAAVLALVFLCVKLEEYKQAEMDAKTIQTFSTYGGKSHITLPDGTSVWLHNGSSIAYSENLTGKTSKERRVSINGEAYFEVTKDEKHPFVVETDGLSVRVLGTKFNVSNKNDQNIVTVGLLQGSVSVETTDKQMELKPYQEAIFNKQSHEMSVQQSDINYMISWAKASIRFESQSLSYVCKYLSKWYGVDIRLDTPETATLAYTFTITDEPLEEIMRLVVRTSPNVSYRFDENNIMYVSLKKKLPMK